MAGHSALILGGSLYLVAGEQEDRMRGDIVRLDFTETQGCNIGRGGGS